jgi:hypothetical protein
MLKSRITEEPITESQAQPLFLVMRFVLVTGANRGIGLAISSLLLKSAQDVVVILACRDVAKGEVASKHLQAEDESYKTRTEVLGLDVSDEASVQQAVAVVKEKFGGLFALVNNAGEHLVSSAVLAAKVWPRLVVQVRESIQVSRWASGVTCVRFLCLRVHHRNFVCSLTLSASVLLQGLHLT